MNKFILVSFLLFITIANSIFAQEDVLFTIGNTKVKKSEFEYIYKKNNINNKADYSKKSLEEYLDLYVNFRLKVQESLSLGLDTLERNKEELRMYENQLLNSYVDKDILDKLINQEYERSKSDVNISHIFFAAPNNADVANAMTKALNASNEIRNKVPFEKVATSSEDKKTSILGGQLGWFNAYQIGLPEIEEAVYKMKVGEVSAPIKTRLGYHIVKLNETRPARPKLKVAIVKRFFPIADTTGLAIKAVEDSMKLAYSLLKANQPMESVVTRFSEDDASVANKGEIDWFGINTYAKVFEETAYALKDNEVSAPFKTNTAWYIVKRLQTSKPSTFDESAAVLKTKLPNLPVYQYEMDKFIQRLSDKYSIKQFQTGKEALRQHIIALAQTAPFVYKDTTAPKTVMQIGNKVYSENDFGKEIQNVFYSTLPKQGADKYDLLINNATQKLIIDYYKNDLKTNNDEFKSLMNEYKNGIMIFSLSEKYIWNKAADDTLGLYNFYKENTSKFDLNDRATVRKITADTKALAIKAQSILKSNKAISEEALLEKLNSGNNAKVKVHSQILDANNSDKINIKQESISNYKLENGKYTITQVLNPLKAQARTFDECRGYVVAAYQENLEKRWINELKQKYPVNINKNVLDSLVKKP